MKITHVTTRVLRMPTDNPLVVGLPAPIDTREFVTIELGIDRGLVGAGLTLLGGAMTPALKAAVDALAHLAVGDDPTQVEAIAAKLRRASGSADCLAKAGPRLQDMGFRQIGRSFDAAAITRHQVG